jgi:hypothetical protein
MDERPAEETCVGKRFRNLAAEIFDMPLESELGNPSPDHAPNNENWFFAPSG